MNTKLTLTLALATSMLGGAAHAFDLDGDVSFDDKLSIDEASSSIDTMWSNDDGKLASDTALGTTQTALNTLAPACTTLPSRSFYQPVHSESLGNQSFSVGVEGRAQLVSDADKLGVEVSFGPAAQIFGTVRRPVDVRLTASSNKDGINSLDLGFYAFGYEIDSYTLADTTNPIQHVASHNWTLPTRMTGPLWTGSIDCKIKDVLPACTLGWSIESSVVANLSSILVLKVNSGGVEAHVIASANSNVALTATGQVSGQLIDPFSDGETVAFSATASGTGALNIGQAYFSTHGTLRPQDSKWVAALDAGYNIEDVLLARATVAFRALGIERRKTLFSRPGRNFSEAYYHQCSFDKQF
jgi:hypothetical protein